MHVLTYPTMPSLKLNALLCGSLSCTKGWLLHFINPAVNTKLFLDIKCFQDPACVSHELSSDSRWVEIGGRKDFDPFLPFQKHSSLEFKKKIRKWSNSPCISYWKDFIPWILILVLGITRIHLFKLTTSLVGLWCCRGLWNYSNTAKSFNVILVWIETYFVSRKK